MVSGDILTFLSRIEEQLCGSVSVCKQNERQMYGNYEMKKHFVENVLCTFRAIFLRQMTEYNVRVQSFRFIKMNK